MTTDNVARLTDTAPSFRAQRSIGAILVDGGRLSVEDAERVYRLQQQEKIRFGEAALKLRVLTQADIDFALSRQFNYEYLQRGASQVRESVVAAYAPFSPQVEGFRTLRSQLILRWFSGDSSKRSLVVVSPAAKEGRSFIVANLGVVFSQLGERVLIIDADLRRPVQHQLFGLENRVGLSSFLAGRTPTAEIQRIEGLRDLSVLSAGPVPPNPIEILSRPTFPRLLAELQERFDVLLVDSPAATHFADAQVLAARMGGALVVARKGATKAANLSALVESLQTSVPIVGTVLNGY